MVKFTVPPEAAGMKLRFFLKNYAQVSTTLWKKIKWHGLLTANGNAINGALYRVQAGDEICYELEEKSTLIPFFSPLEIIYEDEWLLVINKPQDLLIHPTSLACCKTLVNIIAAYYETSGQKAGCHPVYRLDRNTTGLIVVAKRPQIQYALTKSHGMIERFYIALTKYCPLPQKGIFDGPIARATDSIIKRCVSPNGQMAITHYEIQKSNSNLSCWRLKLGTGRTHQIRVHLAHAGFPLLGDDLYGGDCQLIARQALHAKKIVFTHPISGQKLCFTAPLPEDMAKIEALI